MKNRSVYIICLASIVITALLVLFTIEPAYMNTKGWDTHPIPEMGQEFIEFSNRVILVGCVIIALQVIVILALLRLNKERLQ